MNLKRCSRPLFAWREAITDPELGPQGVPNVVARRALVAVAVSGLSLHMSMEGESCWPSIDRLAAETGLGKRTVQRAVAALAETGWLKVRRGGGRGRSNRYELALPAHVQARLGGAENDLGADPEKGVNLTPFPGERVSACPETVSASPEKGVSLAPEIYIEDLHEVLHANVTSLREFRARKAEVTEIVATAQPSWPEFREVPVWTKVWWWALTLGRAPSFPQATGGAPDDEYRRVEREWQAAGSPDVLPDPKLLKLDTVNSAFEPEPA